MEKFNYKIELIERNIVKCSDTEELIDFGIKSRSSFFTTAASSSEARENFWKTQPNGTKWSIYLCYKVETTIIK